MNVACAPNPVEEIRARVLAAGGRVLIRSAKGALIQIEAHEWGFSYTQANLAERANPVDEEVTRLYQEWIATDTCREVERSRSRWGR